MAKLIYLKNFEEIRNCHSKGRYNETHKMQLQYTYVFPSFTLPLSLLRRRYKGVVEAEKKLKKNEDVLRDSKVKVLFRQKHMDDLKQFKPVIHDLDNITPKECLELAENIFKQIQEKKYEARIYMDDEPIVFSIFKGKIEQKLKPVLIFASHNNNKEYTNGLFSDDRFVVDEFENIFNKMWESSGDINIIDELKKIIEFLHNWINVA